MGIKLNKIHILHASFTHHLKAVTKTDKTYHDLTNIKQTLKACLTIVPNECARGKIIFIIFPEILILF
jgi:hypothetical protein